MTARKDPADRKIAPNDMTIKPRKKRGANATPEGKAARIAKLRETGVKNSTNKPADMAACNPDRPLTEKQKLFVSEWAKGETILSASVRAGYADSGQMGYRMSKDPAILKLYNFEKAMYAESCQMTRKKVMEGLLEGVEMAKLMSEPASVIAGWREVGRMCGFYEPVKRTIDVNVKGNVIVKHLEALGDADLLKIVRGEIEDVAFKDVDEDGDD